MQDIDNLAGSDEYESESDSVSSIQDGDYPQSDEPVKKQRSLKWDISHVLILIGVGLSYVYQYLHNEFDVFLYLVILTICVGAVTAIVWRFVAKFTVEAFKSVFDLLHGKHDLLCRIKSPQSEPGSMLDHLYMAVEWSLFPTLVVFFVLSFIAQGIAESGKAVTENNLIFLFLFIIPPTVTFIAIPIRLLTDSSLMRYDIQSRLLEPFGLSFRRMFRAVGGVGAMASFAKVALDKGGIENTMWDTFTILLYVFPTLFIASILYGIWHPGYLRAVENKIERFHYNLYRYHKNVEGIIELQPMNDDTSGTRSFRDREQEFTSLDDDRDGSGIYSERGEIVDERKVVPDDTNELIRRAEYNETTGGVGERGGVGEALSIAAGDRTGNTVMKTVRIAKGFYDDRQNEMDIGDDYNVNDGKENYSELDEEPKDDSDEEPIEESDGKSIDDSDEEPFEESDGDSNDDGDKQSFDDFEEYT